MISPSVTCCTLSVPENSFFFFENKKMLFINNSKTATCKCISSTWRWDKKQSFAFRNHNHSIKTFSEWAAEVTATRTNPELSGRRLALPAETTPAPADSARSLSETPETLEVCSELCTAPAGAPASGSIYCVGSSGFRILGLGLMQLKNRAGFWIKFCENF